MTHPADLQAGAAEVRHDPVLEAQQAQRGVDVIRAYRWLHNVASQATGLGITINSIDCYAAIIRM